ncbi:hypothetical protein BLA15816_00397 [Burkholderia lata]|nr:hypothetical protein BLA15816_00397 [Burkholderia lata]
MVALRYRFHYGGMPDERERKGADRLPLLGHIRLCAGPLPRIPRGAGERAGSAGLRTVLRCAGFLTIG